MPTQSPRSIEELFHQAAALSPPERAPFLDQCCAGDSRLRHRLEILLEGHDQNDDFLAAPATTFALPLSEIREASDQMVGARIGPYEIIRLIGLGGMGSVYEAQQDLPRRLVALKLLRAGLTGPQVARRFRLEAQVLGELRHPGIAQIYEAGIDVVVGGPRAGERQSYFAMELIRGRPIDEYVRHHHVDPRGRLELIAKAADAVHHAHDKGIIHRDLKPGNILVDEFGQPKVLDFGVARIVKPDIQVTMQTEAGQIVGTLAYMSPEQVAGRPEEQDVRTDVYSLGVALYELVAGRPPYELKGRTIPEAARVIREEEPPSLSSVASHCRGDVETIIAKAMEKDKTRRYLSAGELAEDIRRYLRDEPLIARPASALYRIRKYARRHKALVGIATALALGLVGTATFAYHAQGQRRLAEERSAMLRHEAYRANLAAARAALIAHDSASAITYLDACPPELRGWEWRWRRGLYSPPRNVIAVEPGLVCEGVAGDAIVLADQKGTYIFKDPHAGREIRRVRLPVDSMRLFALSPSGDAVLIDGDAGAALFDLQTAGERWRRTDCSLGEGILRPFSSDGQRLVLSEPNSPRMFLLDAHTGRTVRTVDAGAVVRGATLSTDGRTVFACSYGIDEIIDGAGGRTLWRADPALSGIFSPDGRQLLRVIAPGFIANELSIHDARTGRQFAGLDVRSGSARGAAYTPDSAVLATIEHFGEITLRDTSSLNPISVIRSASGAASLYLAFTPDGRSLINWQGTDAAAAFSAMPDPNPMVVKCRFFGEGPSRRRISGDGRSAAVSDWGTMTVFDALRGAARWTRCLGTRTYSPFAFSPQGPHVAAVTPGPRITLFETSTGDPRVTSDRLECAQIVQLDWTPNGECLVAATERNEIVILEGATLRPADCHIPDPESLAGVWLTECEEGILLCAAAGSLEALVPRSAGQTLALERRPLAGWAAGLACIAVDRRRRFLAAGTQAGRILVWDLQTGDRVADLAAADEPIAHLCFSHDASRLAAITRGRLVLVDAVNWKWVDALPANHRDGRAIRFSPADEALVVSAIGTPVIRFEIRPPGDHERDSLLAARELNRRAAAVIAALPDPVRLILDDAISSIEGKPELTSEVRQAAVAFARGLGEQPNWLNSNAWAIARDPGKSAEEYRTAIRYVRVALNSVPEDWAYLNTLGAAQYRAGEYEAAIATMARADEIYAGSGADGGPRGPHPSNGIFAAMSLVRVGRITEGRSLFARVRTLAGEPQFTGDAELSQFLREADELMSSSPGD